MPLNIIAVSGTELSGTQAPSMVTPDYEISRNTERSLDGTFHVDIVYKKRTLQLDWDYLSAEDFAEVQSKFVPENIISVCALGDHSASDYYVDSISRTPFIRDGGIHWRNVSVKLIQI